MSTSPPPPPTAVEGLRVLSEAGPISVRVKGRCMEPLLIDGDKVLVESQTRYWPGDILVFRTDDDLRAHRLLGYGRQQGRWLAVARPDASIDAWDAPIPSDRILGRVTAKLSGESLRITPAQRLAALGRFLLLGARKLGRHLGGLRPSE